MSEQVNQDRPAANDRESEAAGAPQMPPERHHRPRPERPRDRGGRRQMGRRPREGARPPRPEPDPRLIALIQETEAKLDESYSPVQLEHLNAFERKMIHQHFERRKTLYQTKTYRHDDEYVLWIFPLANLKKFAESKAQEAIASGEDVALPPMSSYERFLVHNLLKELGSVETVSVGEGDNRHIEIHPKVFGRSLRRIAKKIKLF